MNFCCYSYVVKSELYVKVEEVHFKNTFDLCFKWLQVFLYAYLKAHLS